VNASVADLGKAPQTLDDVERMLAARNQDLEAPVRALSGKGPPHHSSLGHSRSAHRAYRLVDLPTRPSSTRTGLRRP
jgi:hypothetical protein